VRIEPEGGFPTEGGACCSQNLEDVRVGDEARFPLVGYGVDGSGRQQRSGVCGEFVGLGFRIGGLGKVFGLEFGAVFGSPFSYPSFDSQM
jgi:hypothetical protein